jgi:peptidyl-tRNA hydrolase
LGSQKFNRIRFGIDKEESKDMKDYVLSDFSKQELKVLKDMMIDIDRIITDFKEDIDFNVIMTKYN